MVVLFLLLRIVDELRIQNNTKSKDLHLFHKTVFLITNSPGKVCENQHNHRADYWHAILFVAQTLEENYLESKRSSNVLRHQVSRPKKYEFVSKSGVRN